MSLFGGVWSLVIGTVLSIVGIWYWRSGAREASAPRMLAGAGLVVLTLFVGSTRWLLLAGIPLAALPWLVERFWT